jgi:hypothetical protein
MILPDVNVLIYAFRSDSIYHQVCKTGLDGVVTGNARFGISPLSLSAVVRITTNPRAYKQPSPLDEAFAYCDNLLEQPHCEQIQPGERHWAIFRQLCTVTGLRGARVSDVWTAALAIEHECTWITYDRDYARFPGLDWKEPAA